MAINSKASQEFVPITEVRDGVAILKDETLRAIVLASSLNFSLKSEDEKNAILFQFQDFINSLDFSVQIFIQSRRLDIRPYIALLEARGKDQMNDLMKIQIREYVDFIKNFTENNDIMTKNFFVIIPYSPAIINKNTSFIPFMKRGTNEERAQNKISDFEENKTQLEQRVGVVEQGLVRCGVRVARLGSEEIIELFYKIFNPGETEKPIQNT